MAVTFKLFATCYFTIYGIYSIYGDYSWIPALKYEILIGVFISASTTNNRQNKPMFARVLWNKNYCISFL